LGRRAPEQLRGQKGPRTKVPRIVAENQTARHSQILPNPPPKQGKHRGGREGEGDLIARLGNRVLRHWGRVVKKGEGKQHTGERESQVRGRGVAGSSVFFAGEPHGETQKKKLSKTKKRTRDNRRNVTQSHKNRRARRSVRRTVPENVEEKVRRPPTRQ